MTRRALVLSVAAGMVMALSASPAQAKDDPTKKPPADFKKVSTLVKLPDFLPGMGTLWVDPKTLPAGPYLGYDHKGKLVNVIYMIPLKAMTEHHEWSNLGAVAAGLKIDHTDITYNPGHPGLPEAHYHITNWLIPHSQETDRVGK